MTRSLIDSGNRSRVAARRMLFSRPSKAFIAQGMLKAYSTRRWSQKGTRTSRPTAMLMRSLRSSRVCTKRVRLT
ncbi:hypothetical protein D3C85_1306260 [compost metagenome]